MNLDGLSNVGQVLSAINNAPGNDNGSGGKLVLVSIDADSPSRLKVIDQTTGTATFKIGAINNSVAPIGLGIAGTDIDADGVILGSPLHGDSLFKHVFLKPGDGVSAQFSLAASNLDLFAALGNIEIGIQDGFIGADPAIPGSGPLNFQAGFTLQDPDNSDGKGIITLDELIRKDAQGKFAAIGNSLTLAASGAAVLPLNLGGLEDLLGIPPIDDAQVVLRFGASLNPLTFDLDVETSGLDDIFSGLKDFSTDDLLRLALNAVDLIRSSDLKIFNEPIPLIGKSIREILAFTDQLTGAFDSINEKVEGLKAFLLEKFNGIEQPAGSEVVDGILEVLSEQGSTFVSDLGEDLRTRLFTAVEALGEAILSLPDQISALSFKAPGKLLSRGRRPERRRRPDRGRGGRERDHRQRRVVEQAQDLRDGHRRQHPRGADGDQLPLRSLGPDAEHRPEWPEGSGAAEDR